ncbi:hypothetical protein J2Z49_000495 [Desulfofundulus luciae]|uniref:Ribbon-helix-helix protein CopG domain-containing protein n=1 Tax=Desulfofundulus luciae TaxID=74702 RepID=A0ABU0AY27_9FIRM|nr:hypothetical protein [Desulfofundulus luciae]MDQ0285394.1 hypothetical protein [Desulfofundulus luciae]
MRRMQVVVEEWQYQFLRELASRQGRSISAVLRELIASKANKSGQNAKEPLLEVAGIAREPLLKNLTSESLDEALYRT